MRLLIDASSANVGAGRTRLHELTRELVRESSGHDVTLAVHPSLRAEVAREVGGVARVISPPRHLASPWARTVWQRRGLPRSTQYRRPDVVLGLFNVVATRWPAPAPRVAVMVSSVLPFAAETTQPVPLRLRPRVAALRRVSRSSVSGADLVLFQSEHAAEAVRRSCAVARSMVIGHAPPSPPPSGASRPRSAPTERYLVVVGNLMFYKGVEVVLEALAQLPADIRPRLVVVGKRVDPSYGRVLDARVRDLGLAGHVLLLGERPHAEALALMAAAEACIACSEFENLSRIPGEALAMGTHLVCCDIPAHREAAGDAALYYDPADADGLRAAIERLRTEPALRAALDAASAAAVTRARHGIPARAVLTAVEALGADAERSNPPVRVAILSSCSEPWGGSEELWWETACALRRRGHAVDVLKVGVDAAHPRVRELRRLGCSVTDLTALLPRRGMLALNAVAPRRMAFDPVRAQALAAALALLRRPPHLALVSQGENADGPHLAKVCARLGVPYVVVSQKASERRWPTDAVRPYVAAVLQDARCAVFVSEHNRALTEDQIGAPLPRGVVLPNPVVVGRDGPLPWPADGDGTVRVACMGRLLISQKGQDLLLEVLASDMWRTRPVHLDVYGKGANADGLRGMAAFLGVGNVTFHGHTENVEAVWRRHHLLVLPSRMEGLPLVLLEAMACGRVPVVTDVAGNAELVDDGVTGFVASAPTVAALAEAMERCWAARERWPSIGAAAAARVLEVAPAQALPPLAALLLDEAPGHRAAARRRAARAVAGRAPA